MSEPILPTPSSPPSVGRALSWAFDTFKKNPTAFIALAAVVAVIQMVQQIATGPLQNIVVDCSNPESPGQQAACEAALGVSAFGAIGTALVFGLFAAFATIGVYRAAIRTTQGHTPSFSDMFTTQYLGLYVLLTLATVGLTFVGLLLCCIPGLLVIFFLQLGPYYVLDKGYGVGQAIKASFRVTRANLGPALLLLLFNFLATALGGTLYGVLTLVTLPFAALVTAHVYRQFNGEQIAA